jgi:hypothetical protein
MRKCLLSALLLTLLCFAIGAEDIAPLKAGDFGAAAYLSQGLNSGEFSGPLLGGEYYFADSIGLKAGVHLYLGGEDSKDTVDGYKDKRKDAEYGLALFPFYELRLSNDLYIDLGPSAIVYYTPNYYDYDLENYAYKATHNGYLQASLLGECSIKYLFTSNLGLFASFGAGYTYYRNDQTQTSNAGAKTTDHSLTYDSISTMRAGMGLIFYFR